MQGTRPNARKIILRIVLESIPILLFALLLVADQLSKCFIKYYFENVNSFDRYEVIKGFLFIDYAKNSGIEVESIQNQLTSMAGF